MVIEVADCLLKIFRLCFVEDTVNGTLLCSHNKNDLCQTSSNV